jgi:hypothetical protein
MSEDLTRAQQVLMWELFAAGGCRLNKDITPQPVKKDRDALRQRKLVETRSEHRSISIELTDRGWRWIAEAEPFPIGADEKRVTGERRLLQSLMRSIKRFAAEHEIAIQELFRPSQASRDTAPRDPEPASRAPSASSHDETSIEQQVVAAFVAIAGRPAVNQVRLRALRQRLPHIPRHDLDAALLAMRSARRAKFSTLSNPPDIEAEGDAALAVRDQHFHTIWIDP